VIATASVVFGMAVFSLFEPDLLMLFYMTLPSGSLLLIAVIVLVVLVLRRKRRGLPLHPTIPIVLVAGIGGLPLMALISTLIMFSFSGEMFLAMTILFTIYAIFLGGGFAVVGSIVVAVIAHNQRKKLQPHPAYNRTWATTRRPDGESHEVAPEAEQLRRIVDQNDVA